MKKTILIIALSLVGMMMSLTANAQNDRKVTIGVLGGTNMYLDVNQTNADWHFVPGGSIFADCSVVTFGKGHFTVGGQAGFQYWNPGDNKLGGKSLDFSVAPRLTVGWNLAKWFELHVGTTTGLGISNWRGAKDVNFAFAYSGFVGVRFFFGDLFGLTIEGGYASHTPDVCAGLVFRF